MTAKKHGPKFGVASWLLNAPSFTKAVKWAAENGFESIALHPNVMDKDKQDRIDAAAVMHEHGLRLSYHPHVPGLKSSPLALDEDTLRKFVDDIAWWCEQAGRMHCVCFDVLHVPNANGPDTFATEATSRALEIVHEKLGRYGIRPGVENWMGRGGFGSLEQLRYFRDFCSVPRTGMLLDLGHANMHVRSESAPGESNIYEFIKGLPFDILEVHVQDNMGVKDEHREVGIGNMDIAAAFKALKERGFNGHFTMEVCLDILNKKYGADISKPEEYEPILRTLAKARETWNSLPAKG